MSGLHGPGCTCGPGEYAGAFKCVPWKEPRECAALLLVGRRLIVSATGYGALYLALPREEERLIMLVGEPLTPPVSLRYTEAFIEDLGAVLGAGGVLAFMRGELSTEEIRVASERKLAGLGLPVEARN